jgi:hypothetical protein
MCCIPQRSCGGLEKIGEHGAGNYATASPFNISSRSAARLELSLHRSCAVSVSRGSAYQLRVTRCFPVGQLRWTALRARWRATFCSVCLCVAWWACYCSVDWAWRTTECTDLTLRYVVLFVGLRRRRSQEHLSGNNKRDILCPSFPWYFGVCVLQVAEASAKCGGVCWRLTLKESAKKG